MVYYVKLSASALFCNFVWSSVRYLLFIMNACMISVALRELSRKINGLKFSAVEHHLYKNYNKRKSYTPDSRL